MFRKSVNYVLAAVFIAAAFVACTPKEEKTDKTGYFRAIRFSETPWDIPAGNHAITAEEAKNINHYRFSYNEAGKLAAIEFMRDTVLLDYSGTGAAKLVFEYTDSTEMVTAFNSKGEQIVDGDNVWKNVYGLNADGMRVSLHFLGKDGEEIENVNKIHNYVWEKLKDGKIRELRYNLAGVETVMNPFCPFYELRFTYNAKGFVVEMANYQGDSLYNCTAENCGETGVSFFSFTNNEAGDLLEFKVKNTAGNFSNLYWGWARFEQVVDTNGYVTERAYYDQDGDYIVGKQAPVRQYVYNEFGAVVEVKNMDGKRALMETGDKKVATVKYTYNEVGQPTDTLRYDAKGVEVL